MSIPFENNTSAVVKNMAKKIFGAIGKRIFFILWQFQLQLQ